MRPAIWRRTKPLPTRSTSAAGFPQDCSLCHSTTNWLGATLQPLRVALPAGGQARQPRLASVAMRRASTRGLPPPACPATWQSTRAPPTRTTRRQAFRRRASCATHPRDGRPRSFNHATTVFPLTGAHTSVACANCHVGGKYVGTPTDCYSCHKTMYNTTTNPNHTAAGFPTTCQTCHTTTNLGGRHVQPHLVPVKSPRGSGGLQHVPHQPVGLQGVPVHRLPRQGDHGFASLGQDRVRVQQRELLRMSPEGELMRKILLILWVVAGLLPGQTSKPVPTYRVKHVAEGAVYLEGGRSAGLSEGVRLTIRRPAAGAQPERVVAELEVTSVASASAVCEIKSSQGEIEAGDTAYLSLEDAELLQAVKSSEAGKKYVQVVTFTEGDPLDEEARAAVPHAPSPAVNRVRGRIGFEYNTIRQPGGGGDSSQLGLVVRADMTRIGGSYWSVSGFWRGRLSSRNSGTQQPTITDLLNRTYHLSLTYSNPQSPWMAGFGRLFLPWANSLETIDGGYLAHRIGRRFTAGTFAGSTPDPTSWNYNPNRQLAGSFLNYTAGTFETVRVSSTAGLALSYIQWKPERAVRLLRERPVLQTLPVRLPQPGSRPDQRPAGRSRERHARQPEFPDRPASTDALSFRSTSATTTSETCRRSIHGSSRRGWWTSCSFREYRRVSASSCRGGPPPTPASDEAAGAATAAVP